MSLESVQIHSSTRYETGAAKGVLLSSIGEWKLERVLITGPLNTGLELRGFIRDNRQPLFMIKDVQIDRGFEREVATFGVECVWCEGHFENFSISGYDAGLSASTSKPLSINSVLLRNNNLGLKLSRDFELVPLNVLYEGNTENFLLE